ncbi:MAG: 5'/3'-nucleotidase SurE [Bacteroidales bacterium]|nr:5'/3'-nucleotidase SurE [Bacteroidales bacterium]
MNEEKQPLILISNDDGVFAKGLKVLVNAVKHLGQVVVVSPDKPQSGKGHCITLDSPLWYRVSKSYDHDVLIYKCTGTPVDCIKLALLKILDRKPDLILSGINHGSNSSINVVYSGTLGAAIEGAIHNIPSIGFSILNFAPDADFDYASNYVTYIVENVLKLNKNKSLCLNVNIPYSEPENIKGIKIVRQAKAYWDEYFQENVHPYNHKSYYWLGGNFVNKEPDAEDTDEWALANGYISITPIQIDHTDYNEIKVLKQWNL